MNQIVGQEYDGRTYRPDNLWLRLPAPDVIKRMTDLLKHRGPDDEGFHFDPAAALGHRRLSIIDLAGGHQPIANEDETRFIVFNGEIYNHREIRAALEKKGHRYRTASDTETILHLVEEEGVEGLNRMNGMWAYAILDRQRSGLILSRDRFSIKPLYYTKTARGLFFASEIKQLLPQAEVVGFDVSRHGLADAPEAIRPYLFRYRAQDAYPFGDKYFDLVISLGCLHNLRVFELETACGEIERVGKRGYIMLESYRSELELFNLQCWALTCESFFDTAEWIWLYDHFGYTGDYEFIYFE